MTTNFYTPEVKKQKDAEYYQKNKAKIKLRVEAYRQRQITIDIESWRQKTTQRMAIYRSREENRKTIQSASSRYRLNNPLRYLYNHARCRARVKGHEFNIEESDLFIPEVCPLLEIPLCLDGPLDTRPSIDRIDSTKGYIKGNVWVVSHKANRLKNNATLEDLRLLYINFKQKVEH